MTLLQARTTKVVFSGVLFLAGVLFLTPCGFATNIQVKNPSFEIHPPFNNHTSPGPFTTGEAIPGWMSAQIAPGVFIGQFQPAPGVFNHGFPDGSIVAYSSVDGSTISQNVGMVHAGEIYTLLVDLGHRKDGPNFAAAADLMVGSHTFVATGHPPGPGDFSIFTARFDSNASEVGDSIIVQLKSSGSQAIFDDVRVTATPIPEPGTLLLFGTGLLLVGIIVYRKQLHAKRVISA